MNIIVINDIGVDVFRRWSEVKKQLNMTKEDFTEVGVDYVCNLTGDSYEVAKDIRLLERVASERVFAKSKMEMTDWAVLGTFVLLVISLVK